MRMGFVENKNTLFLSHDSLKWRHVNGIILFENKNTFFSIS